MTDGKGADRPAKQLPTILDSRWRDPRCSRIASSSFFALSLLLWTRSSPSVLGRL